MIILKVIPNANGVNNETINNIERCIKQHNRLERRNSVWAWISSGVLIGAAFKSLETFIRNTENALSRNNTEWKESDKWYEQRDHQE